jgi:rhodanese-related sulfurtransferase
MGFTREDIAANRLWFAGKLRAEKQLAEVKRWVEEGAGGGFLLLDVRPRNAFAKAHVPGALCAPLEEIDRWAAELPHEELVVYCWNEH